MLFLYRMPDVGEGISEGEIVQWLIREGDAIVEDAPLLEVQNDKLLQEIPSPVSGVVKRILVPAGTIARVGDGLIEIETNASQSMQVNQSEQNPDTSHVQPSIAHGSEQPNIPHINPPLLSMVQTTPTTASYPDNSIAGRVLAMPSIRHYARQHDIDLTAIQATGKHGHVTKHDVDLVIKTKSSQAMQPIMTAQSTQPMQAMQSAPSNAGMEDVRREPFSITRKAIAKAMVNSKTKIPHVSLFDEVEVTQLMAHRERFKGIAAAQDIKLTYLPYVVKAVIAVARKYPVLNASVDDTAKEIIYKNEFHVGIAVDTDQGLYVPNIKKADTKGIFTIAKEISKLTQAAKQGTLAVADMRNGTITITNVGSVGGMWFTPIINHPEVAIFGIGRIAKKPIVLADESIGIGHVMTLSLSFDHRIVDGKTAQLAMNEFKALLADPERLLMEG